MWSDRSDLVYLVSAFKLIWKKIHPKSIKKFENWLKLIDPRECLSIS
jgi:hypothetical protein